MYFPEFDGLHMEFLVVEHDPIGKSYLVQWLGSEPTGGRTRSRSVAFCARTLSTW